MTKPVPIKAARDLGKKYDCSHLVVFQFWDSGRVAVTSYGSNKYKCDQAKQWSNKRFNELTAGVMRSPDCEFVREETPRCDKTEDMFEDA